MVRSKRTWARPVMMIMMIPRNPTTDCELYSTLLRVRGRSAETKQMTTRSNRSHTSSPFLIRIDPAFTTAPNDMQISKLFTLKLCQYLHSVRIYGESCLSIFCWTDSDSLCYTYMYIYANIPLYIYICVRELFMALN